MACTSTNCTDVAASCANSQSEEIGTTSADAFACNASTIDKVVNGSSVVTNRVGNQLNSIVQLEANYIITPINGGVWAEFEVFTAFNQFMGFGGISYKPKLSTTLPYVVGATPIGDLNVEPFSDLTVSEADSRFDRRFDSVAQAVAATDLILAQVIKIGERADALFKIVTGEVPNTFNIIDLTGSGLQAELRVNGFANVIEFAGINPSSAGQQAAANYAKDNNVALVYPDENYTIDTTIDLTSPGGGAEGFRNIEVIAGREAYFSGALSTTNLFDISGQRRFTWTGGRFLFGNKMFFQDDASSTAPTASTFFYKVIFAPTASDAIGRCYQADTSIGVYWTDCTFGTDLASNAIDIAIELTGASSQETNINAFYKCTFRGLTNGAILLTASAFNRTVINCDTCWFEDINGPALEAFSVARSIMLKNCYFEKTGSVTKASIVIQGGASVSINGGNISGNQNNATSFVTCNAGGELVTSGNIVFFSDGTRQFLELTNPAGTNILHGVGILGTGTEIYEDLLFGGSSFLQYVDYSNPRITSTLATTTRASSHYMNVFANGFLTHRTDTVNISAETTDFTVATINIPNAAHCCRISVDIFQTIQNGAGTGRAGRSSEWATNWDGAAWQFTAGRDLVAGVGWLITPVSVDVNTFTIDLQRASGGVTNTPARVAISIVQGTENLEGNEITIT